MKEITVKVKIPDEFEGFEKEIEDIINKEVEEVIKRLKALNKAKGCLRTNKTWQELEAELYENIY